MEPRHEGHHDGHGHSGESTHFLNIKYGYINLAVTGLYFAFVIWYERRQVQKFNLNQNQRARSLSIPAHIILWTILIGVMNVSVLLDFLLSVFLKRFGRLSYSLVPLNLALILKPNFINYLILIPIHKWLSRFIVILAAAHSIGFLLKWLVAGELFKAFRLWNFLGLVLFIWFLVLVVISLRKFRTKNYLLFYLFHNASVLGFLVLVTLHARPGVSILTGINVLILLLNLLTKFNYCNIPSSSIKTIKFKSLTLVKFEKPINYPILLPGSHLRFIDTKSGNWLWKPSHPYTIINNHEHINLIVNNQNKFPNTILDPSYDSNYILSYPFSPNFNMINYQQDLTYFVIGGSGISFYLSFFNYYQNLNIDFNAKLFWSIKHKQDLNLLDQFNLPAFVLITVFITQDNPPSEETNFDVGSDLDHDSDDRGHLLGQQEGGSQNIPLQTLTKTEKSPEKYDIHYTRMDVSQLTPQPRLLVSCGPNSLIEDCEQYCKSNDIEFVKEYYSF